MIFFFDFFVSALIYIPCYLILGKSAPNVIKIDSSVRKFLVPISGQVFIYSSNDLRILDDCMFWLVSRSSTRPSIPPRPPKKIKECLNPEYFLKFTKSRMSPCSFNLFLIEHEQSPILRSYPPSYGQSSNTSFMEWATRTW